MRGQLRFQRYSNPTRDASEIADLWSLTEASKTTVRISSGNSLHKGETTGDFKFVH